MSMKEKYITPVIEIIEFYVEDIITASIYDDPHAIESINLGDTQ